MKTKKRDLLNRYIPLWSIVPLVTIMAVNCLIYWGSSALTAGRYHFDFTMAFDREVPLLPVFVWFYILAFPFWAVGYLLAARRGKDMFYRFVATDQMAGTYVVYPEATTSRNSLWQACSAFPASKKATVSR